MAARRWPARGDPAAKTTSTTCSEPQDPSASTLEPSETARRACRYRRTCTTPPDPARGPSESVQVSRYRPERRSTNGNPAAGIPGNVLLSSDTLRRKSCIAASCPAETAGTRMATLRRVQRRSVLHRATLRTRDGWRDSDARTALHSWYLANGVPHQICVAAPDHVHAAGTREAIPKQNNRRNERHPHKASGGGDTGRALRATPVGAGPPAHRTGSASQHPAAWKLLAPEPPL